MNSFYKIDYVIKTIIIGNSGVGKTTILHELSDKNIMLTSNIVSTVGVDFYNQMINFNNKNIKIQFWDTSGQEKFFGIVKSFYKNIAICYIMYDVTNRETFDNVEKWIHDYNINSTNQNVIFVLIGNKIDNIYFKCVSTKEAMEFAQKNNMIFIETSYKDKISLENLIKKPIEKLFNLINTKIIIPNSFNGITSNVNYDENHNQINNQSKKDLCNCVIL